MKPGRQGSPQPQRVVGIGASAGGLDPLKQLLARLPTESGLAFVVLQHLPPSQTGKLAAILAKATTMPVVDVESGERMAPDRVYVVPPSVAAGLFRGALVLRAPKGGARPHLPIDGLFRSLAAVLGERAIGVVLSGTASDGTEGLRAIQTAGGLTFAQDPSTAQFDQMPRNAIAAGVAESVLPPGEIADELGAIAKLVAPRPKPGSKLRGLEHVLEQLREASGIDFASYKRTTIERRLARRLAKHRLHSLDEYAGYLAEHPDEARAVYEDLLVHVTEFFRDRPALDELVARVLPEILRDKPAEVPIRVWVPGCSTGEEVYSLAMLLLEHVGEQRRLQLFGTDLSERSIEVARTGYYPEAIARQVGKDRLVRFFIADGDGYRIKREVRERCVFVRHDLVSDPPFSKLDLVSCRNVLIYLGIALQKRVIPIFHYALAQPGYLLLGRSESIAGFESLFAHIDADAPIFSRKPAQGLSGLTFALAGQIGKPLRRATDGRRSSIDVQRDVDHVLLARYAPACVLVDDNLDVVQFRGRTGRYLEPAAGQPQVNLLRMARDGLVSDLRTVIQRAQRGDAPVRQENIAVVENGHDRRVDIEVVPLRGAADAKRYLLVIFEEAPPTLPLKLGKAGKAGKPGKAARAAKLPPARAETVRLGQELAATKEYLHSVVAQHLATSEDLGVANEELQSANEEMQSTNEELQTAKEELESTNEELETVNEQLQRGNQELRQANDDLVNVLAGVDIAIIIVDRERRVRRFTPKARSVMNLIPGDVGRPIIDLQPSVSIPDLDGAIANVIETLATTESEVMHPDGTWYRLQIRPYRTADDQISGAVIAFVDITALHRSVEASDIARDYADAIVDAVSTPLVVVDERLVIQSANRAFHDLVGADTAGRTFFDVGDWRGSDVHAKLESGAPFDAVEIEYRRGTGTSHCLRIGARLIPRTDGRRLTLIAIIDVTEQRQAEQQREAFLNAVSHELRTPLSGILLWTQVLRGLPPSDPRHAEAVDTIEQSARAEAQLVDDVLELALSRADGSTSSPPTESIDPSSVVEAAIDDARRDANEKRVAIETAFAKGPRIQADPRRLRRIASHLVSNAIKFAPVGGRVWVELSRDDHTLELSVRDSGQGIPPEFLAHLFEPFSQADRSLTRTQPGLGIGLALVRHLVERQSGTIEVEGGGDGRGATFKVRLPL